EHYFVMCGYNRGVSGGRRGLEVWIGLRGGRAVWGWEGLCGAVVWGEWGVGGAGGWCGAGRGGPGPWCGVRGGWCDRCWPSGSAEEGARRVLRRGEAAPWGGRLAARGGWGYSNSRGGAPAGRGAPMRTPSAREKTSSLLALPLMRSRPWWCMWWWYRQRRAPLGTSVVPPLVQCLRW